MAEYERSKTNQFVNPYNFISLSGERSDDLSDLGERSGVIHCRLKTKTPLCVPDVEKMRKDNDHPIYPFFKIDDLYAIPGSSLRGVIRSVYETLTGSCFVTLPKEYYLTARIDAKNPFKPAILKREDNQWVLYSANRYLLKNNKNIRIKTENEIRFVSYNDKKFYYGDAVNYSELNGCVNTLKSMDIVNAQGCVFVGEPIFNKRAESVFSFGDRVDVSPEEIQNAFSGLKQTIEIYRNKSINRNLGTTFKSHLGYPKFEDACEKGMIPIWYKEENKHLYFSMAAIGRKSYANSVSELMDEKYSPCTNRKDACPACQLFGMAKEESFASHIRITDARLVTGKVVEKIRIKELGSPRTGYLPFYSVDGLSYDETGAKIKGRKFYWHNSKAEKSDEPYKDKGKQTKRNATVDLMDKDSEFTFDVYYDGISESQLRSLEWVLTLGDNSKDSSKCYKIGHGKSIGLGSAKITIDGIEERMLKDSYSVVSRDVEISAKYFDEKLVNQINVAMDYYAIKDDISYPYVELKEGQRIDATRTLKDNVLANHQWFTSNKGRRSDDLPPQTLNSVTEDQKMYTYEVTLNSERDYKPIVDGKRGKNRR